MLLLVDVVVPLLSSLVVFAVVVVVVVLLVVGIKCRSARVQMRCPPPSLRPSIALPLFPLQLVLLRRVIRHPSSKTNSVGGKVEEEVEEDVVEEKKNT